jgi:hypothetical protein
MVESFKPEIKIGEKKFRIPFLMNDEFLLNSQPPKMPFLNCERNRFLFCCIFVLSLSVFVIVFVYSPPTITPLLTTNLLSHANFPFLFIFFVYVIFLHKSGHHFFVSFSKTRDVCLPHIKNKY